MLKIGMTELDEARKLQEKAAQLHLPPPPVVSFKVQKTDSNGTEHDILYSKSNSYLRNAYNILALYLTGTIGVGNTLWLDGVISLRTGEGNIVTNVPISVSNGSVQHMIGILGSGGTPDSIDDYSMENIIVPNEAGKNIHTQSRQTFWDSVGRRMITYFIIKYSNIGDEPFTAREAGISIGSSSPDFGFLILRDVFPQVTVNPGEQIAVTYQLELFYPPA